MVHGAAVDLFVLLVGSLVGTLIGAVVLKTSCALFNLLAGAWGELASRPTPQEVVKKHETGIQVEPVSTPMPDANLETIASVPPNRALNGRWGSHLFPLSLTPW